MLVGGATAAHTPSTGVYPSPLMLLNKSSHRTLATAQRGQGGKSAFADGVAGGRKTHGFLSAQGAARLGAPPLTRVRVHTTRRTQGSILPRTLPGPRPRCRYVRVRGGGGLQAVQGAGLAEQHYLLSLSA